jgi:hypothetical protein
MLIYSLQFDIYRCRSPSISGFVDASAAVSAEVRALICPPGLVPARSAWPDIFQGQFNMNKPINRGADETAPTLASRPNHKLRLCRGFYEAAFQKAYQATQQLVDRQYVAMPLIFETKDRDKLARDIIDVMGAVEELKLHTAGLLASIDEAMPAVPAAPSA